MQPHLDGQAKLLQNSQVEKLSDTQLYHNTHVQVPLSHHVSVNILSQK